MPEKVNISFKCKYIPILISIIAFSIVGFVTYQNLLNISIDNIPKGEFIKEVNSPSGEYSIKIYIVNGGATVDYAIRGELVYKKEKRKSQNIYWNYHESSTDVFWIDDTNVRINAKTLNVLKDRYDFRLTN